MMVARHRGGHSLWGGWGYWIMARRIIPSEHIHEWMCYGRCVLSHGLCFVILPYSVLSSCCLASRMIAACWWGIEEHDCGVLGGVWGLPRIHGRGWSPAPGMDLIAHCMSPLSIEYGCGLGLPSHRGRV